MGECPPPRRRREEQQLWRSDTKKEKHCQRVCIALLASLCCPLHLGHFAKALWHLRDSFGDNLIGQGGSSATQTLLVRIYGLELLGLSLGHLVQTLC